MVILLNIVFCLTCIGYIFFRPYVNVVALTFAVALVYLYIVYWTLEYLIFKYGEDGADGTLHDQEKRTARRLNCE